MSRKMKGLVFDAEFCPREGYRVSERELNDHRAFHGSQIWRNPKLELREVAIPELEEDEVLCRTGACGVCGSDMKMLVVDKDGYTGFVGHCKLPCVVGHECSGEIVRVGSKVRDFKVGDLVTADEMLWCGECDACKEGMFNQCKNLEELGLTIGGGFSEYFKVKEKYLFSLNELAEQYGDREKALEIGCLVEPVSVAYNACITRGGGIKPGAYVCVFGCGPIGLAAIGILKAAGAAKIIAFDFQESRLAVAQKMHADHVINLASLKDKDAADVVMELTDGNGVDLAVEATGHTDSTYPQIENVLAPGAKVVQIGQTNAHFGLNTATFQSRAAMLVGSIGTAGHGNYKHVLRLLTSGALDITPMIAGKFDLDHAIEGIKDAAAGCPGKNIIKPKLL